MLHVEKKESARGSSRSPREWLVGKRIAYVITRSDTVAGAQVHVADVASRMQEAGAKVCVFVGGAGPYTEKLQSQGIPYVVLGHLCRPIRVVQDMRGLSELRQALKTFKPTLVSAHSSKAGILARLASLRSGFAVVFTAHGWSFTEGVSPVARHVYERVERAVAPLARRIITVSEYDRQLALKRGIANSDRLRTVHNGMPDVGRALWAQPSTAPVRLVTVARLDEPKDHELLVTALAGLESYGWSLDIIGDGPHEQAIKALVNRCGLRDRIRFLGLRRDVPELLSQAHVFVLCTKWEGLPRSIIEAMRTGLPVVASRVGGVPELVEDGVTGFLVSKGNLDEMRERLRTLLDDPSMRETMGAAGRAAYEANFRIETMIEKTVQVYREALDAP